jgi:transcription termination factor Rho
LLIDEESLKQIWLLRRMVAMIASDSVSFVDATERILDRLRKTNTNVEFLANLNKET